MYKSLEQRRIEDQERREEWRKLSPQEQLRILDQRLGKGIGAKRQRAKIAKGYPMSKRGTIAIDLVTEEFFIRQALYEDHVQHLALLYENGTKLPPIIVSRDRNKLVEGRHRLAALRLLNRVSVDVEWIDATDNGELLIHALRANIGGALPPTNWDIINAISQMIEAGVVRSVITKNFENIWPPAVIRHYLDAAQSAIGATRLIKAKSAVVEGRMTVGEAALTYKVKLPTLQSSLQGKKKLPTLQSSLQGKKKRKSGTAEFKNRVE